MISHSEVREKMAELMDELPDDIEECEDYSLIYRGSNMLRQRVEELYVDLLAAMEDFVNWYMQGTASRLLTALHSGRFTDSCRTYPRWTAQEPELWAID